MDKEIADMLEKGLINIAKESVLKADKFYKQLQELSDTVKQEHHDIFTCFLRTHREN